MDTFTHALNENDKDMLMYFVEFIKGQYMKGAEIPIPLDRELHSSIFTLMVFKGFETRQLLEKYACIVLENKAAKNQFHVFPAGLTPQSEKCVTKYWPPRSREYYESLARKMNGIHSIELEESCFSKAFQWINEYLDFI